MTKFIIATMIIQTITIVYYYFSRNYYRDKADKWYNRQEQIVSNLLNDKDYYDEEDLREMLDSVF